MEEKSVFGYEEKEISKLITIYLKVKDKIKLRIQEFKEIWEKGSEEDIFYELIFCLLTPQSKAKSCWQAVKNLCRGNLLFRGNKEQIVKILNIVRFKNKKAEYIISARNKFYTNGKIIIKSKISEFNAPENARDWLANNVKGIGYKEASHFLRNIGYTEEFAILDRHIMKNLKLYRVIDKIPKSLSHKKYIQIEGKMKKFSEEIKIPVSHLDLLLWFKQTGEIFK